MEDLGQLRPELYQTDEKCAHERTKPGKKIEEVVEEFYGNTWFAVRFDRKESRSVFEHFIFEMLHFYIKNAATMNKVS